MPQFAASSADIGSPVAASSHVRDAPTMRLRNQTAPESGTSPALMNASTSFALSDAMRKSHARAMLAPAPAATPLTAARTGFGAALSARISGL
jgi:hypothetical protein